MLGLYNGGQLFRGWLTTCIIDVQVCFMKKWYGQTMVYSTQVTQFLSRPQTQCLRLGSLRWSRQVLSLMMTSTSSLDSCWRRGATASHKCYISFPFHLFQEVDGKEILLDAEWLEGLYSKLELVEGKELSLPWQGKGGRVTYWRGYSGSSDTQTHTSTSTHDK